MKIENILVKNDYKILTFPLNTQYPLKDSDSIFKLYLEEFGFKKRLFFKKFVSIILSATKDYFEGNLSNSEMQILAMSLWTHPLTKKFHNRPTLKKHNKLLSFIFGFKDLVWDSEGKYFEKQITEYEIEWYELATVYETYFTKNKNILDKINYPIKLQSFTLRYGKKPLVKTEASEKYFK